MSTDVLERSRSHIDNLYKETIKNLERQLREREASGLKLEHQHCGQVTFFGQMNDSKLNMVLALNEFVSELRRYYVSDSIRIGYADDLQFTYGSTKRKLQVYLSCVDERAYACEKYKQLVVEAKTVLECLDNQDFKDVFCRLKSKLRCEKCGRGKEKHTRPGLLVEHELKRR